MHAISICLSFILLFVGGLSGTSYAQGDPPETGYVEMWIHQVDTNGDSLTYTLTAIGGAWRCTSAATSVYEYTTDSKYTAPTPITLVGDVTTDLFGYSTTPGGDNIPEFGVAFYELTVMPHNTTFYLDYRDARFWDIDYDQDHRFTYNADTGKLRWESTNPELESWGVLSDGDTIRIWTIREEDGPGEPIRPHDLEVSGYSCEEGTVPKLSWTAYPQQFWSSYKIYRSINNQGGPPGTFTHLATLQPDASSYVDYSLSYGGQWKVYYRVVSVSSSGGQSRASKCPDTLSCGSGGFLKRGADPGTPVATTRSTLTAYPNPFNPQVTLELRSDAPWPFEISIINVTGQTVDVIRGEAVPDQSMRCVWDASRHPSGVYIARAVWRTGEGTHLASERLLLIK